MVGLMAGSLVVGMMEDKLRFIKAEQDFFASRTEIFSEIKEKVS